MIWIFHLLSLTSRCVIAVCGSIKGNICCPGFYWNKETSECENCPLGYHNINCSEMCKFPSFGEDCQGTCRCDISLCDHRSGCITHNDTLMKRTSYFQFSTAGQLTETNELVTKIQSPGASLEVYRLSNTVLYLIIVIAGVFVFLSSVCVGTYFYKHCIKKTVSANNQGPDYIPKHKDGYNSLEMGVQESEHQFTDPTYLEPVSNPRTHYDEIIDHRERSTQSVSDVLRHPEIENKQLSDFIKNYANSRNYLPLDEKKTQETKQQKTAFKTSSL